MRLGSAVSCIVPVMAGFGQVLSASGLGARRCRRRFRVGKRHGNGNGLQRFNHDSQSNAQMRSYRKSVGLGVTSKSLGDTMPGPIAVADVDQDGDLDVFVGGRAVTGHYPQARCPRFWHRGAGWIGRRALE